MLGNAEMTDLADLLALDGSALMLGISALLNIGKATEFNKRAPELRVIGTNREFGCEIDEM